MLQNESSKTGNGTESRENLKFPVRFDLKIVLEANTPRDDQQSNINQLLDDLQLENSYINHKMSTKGTYCSFTYQVTVPSRDQLLHMYSELKQLQGFKFAL